MAKWIYSLILALTFLQVYARKKDSKSQAGDEITTISKPDTMKLKITIGEKTATGILYDNPTSKDFSALLPLTVELADYNHTEKISNLPNKLSVKKAPAGFDPSVGDITYYAPWGNIALFYKDFGYSDGLISLGKITSGIEAFKGRDSLTVKIELER